MEDSVRGLCVLQKMAQSVLPGFGMKQKSTRQSQPCRGTKTLSFWLFYRITDGSNRAHLVLGQLRPILVFAQLRPTVSRGPGPILTAICTVKRKNEMEMVMDS